MNEALRFVARRREPVAAIKEAGPGAGFGGLIPQSATMDSPLAGTASPVSSSIRTPVNTNG